MLKNSLKNLIARGSYAWLILLLSPLLVSRSSEFLGQDVSAIAAGILGFYPWVAVGQFVLLGILSWLVTLIVAFAVKIIWPQVKPSFHCSLILLYFFACFSFSLLKYPAFFTDFIPQYLDRIVWMVAKYVSPDIPLDILIISPVIIVGSRLLYLGGKKAAQRNGRIFGVLCCIFVVFLGVWYREGKNSSRQGSLDHILIVAIDSLRFDGISEEKTPHLWALKHHDRTVTFQDHIVGIPRTFPSWLEILSGQYASQTGIRHMFPAFDVREKNRLMMGDVLKKMGFSTFLVSDFAGDIFPRFRTGFSIVDAPTLTISEIIKFNITQQFRLYLPIFVRLSQWGFYGLFQQSPTLADPKRIADKFFDLKPRDGSWMGMLFFSTAHFPYAAPHPYYRKFVDNGYSGEFFFKKNPDIKISGQKINDHERKQVIALYDGALNAVDQQVGRIIESLKKTGEWDQTTLILTADHGEQLYDDGILQGHGEHLRGEWVLKVPLLIKIGGMNAISKRVVHAVTQSVDIFPTLLGILGEKKPEFLPELITQIIFTIERVNKNVSLAMLRLEFGLPDQDRLIFKKIALIILVFQGFLSLISVDLMRSL